MINNRIIKKLGLSTLGLSVIIGSTYAFTSQNKVLAKPSKHEEVKELEKQLNKSYPALLRSQGKDKDKYETTYVIMDNNNNINDVIVSSILTNNKNEKEIKDYSNLKNIENTSGEETFTNDKQNIIWKSNGNKIEYKGKGNKNLPVNIKVSYYLNGEEKSAKDIKGKSGNIKIRFNYNVLQKDYIKGKYYQHPYTMMSGLILDNSHFTDIKVTNGKAINDGSKSMVLGLAFPYMNDNLGVSTYKLDIPSYVEISAYTNNFKIPGTYTVALSGLFTDIENNNINDVENKIYILKKNLNDLANASKELLQGSDDLYSAFEKLDEGINKLKDGVNNLNEGTNKLVSGAKELNDGLLTLSQNSNKINNSLRSLETTIFENATKEIRIALNNNTISLTPTNYISVINGISEESVNIAITKIRNNLKGQGIIDENSQNTIMSIAYNYLITNGKADATNAEIANALSYAGNIAQKTSYVNNAILKNKTIAITFLNQSGKEMSEQNIALIATAIELAGGNTNLITSKLTEAQTYLEAIPIFKVGESNALENIPKLGAIAVGKETPQKLSALKTNLDNVEFLVIGINNYTKGVDKAALGSKNLYNGLIELNKGTEELKNGTNTLYNGSTKFKEGLYKVNQGMNKFNQEGIDKFVSTLNKESLTNILHNIENIKEASNRYPFVGGKLPSMTGESKIIFKTDEI